MIDHDTAERFMDVVRKHEKIVTLDLLIDLTRALGLTVNVNVIDKTEPKEEPD